ncbi:MAG: phage tail tape measure protein, partial [Candidatus Peribacteraceae bacterium]|nr:phage tail tape measure protein [Candidatus Peribacteraceae bacterium]
SFEAQLSKLEAVSGSTEGELARLSAQARNVGSTTSSSASEVASLQIELARLGFSAQEISEATPAVRDFAVALDAELGRSAEFAGAVVKSFNLTTQDTARILDVATAAANSSALNFDRLALGVPKAAKAAESAGLNFANLTALLGKLKDNGLDVETSGVGIRNILLKLNEVGSDTADILGSDVNSFQDLIQVLRVAKGDTNRLKEAQKEFGLRNAIVFKTLVDNVDGLQAYSDELENSQGLTKKTADIMEDNFQGAVKGLSSAFESLQISIFNLVKGPGEDLINFLTETTREWDNLLLRFDKTTQLSQKGLLPFVDNVKRLRVELDEASKAAKRTGEFNERLISSRLSTKLKVATKNLQEFVSKGLATQVQVDILLGDKTFKEAQKDIEAQAKKKAPGGAAATKPGLSEDEKKRRAKEKAERLKFEARAQNDLLSLKARSKENEFARDRALEEIRFKEKTKAALDLNASDAAIIKENNLIKSQIDAAEALKKIEDAKALSTILEENRIMALENRFDRERALEAARFNERIEMEETTAAQVIALEEQKAREIEKINVAEQFSIDRRAKFELKQKQKSALKNIELQNQVGQAGVNAAKFFAGENKKIAVSEAIIHGVVAVQKAWASAPPPANLPAVALAGTATALNVQTAKNAKFAVGGMVGGSGGGRSDSVNASLSRGEFVMPADVTRRRRGELENMRLGGSSTTNSNTINFSPTVNISSSGGSQDVDLFTGAMKTTLSELLQEMNQEGFALA